MTMNKTNIIITGGGTGGHLFPGIAAAQGLQERLPACKIMFIGTRRHLDKSTLARYPFTLRFIKCSGLKGKGIAARITGLIQILPAVLSSIRLIRSHRPVLILGVGGYVTGPVLLAGKILGIPTCIHEQNSVPGMANKLLARFVDRIFLSIPVDEKIFPPHKTILTGNPVRREILRVSEKQKDEKTEKRTILILGGSQGAHSINMLMIKAAGLIKKNLDTPFLLLHQSGSKDLEQVRRCYREMGIEAQVEEFFDDMAAAYEQADLVVSRAGATTLAELAVLGLPALLIPYPYAADNHQEMNGLHYQKGGGAILLKQSDLTGKILAGEITSLLNDPKKLHSMRDCMKELGRPEATRLLVDNCLQVIQDTYSDLKINFQNNTTETHV